METYRTERVCARQINYEIKDGKIYNVQFIGGCDGNLKAIAKLVEGKNIKEVSELLENIECGGRGTSCGDQLSKALKAVIKK